MPRLYPTPPDKLVDAAGRPYFLWDVDWTLDEFLDRLASATGEGRAYLVGKVMRQAKPDDALQFVEAAQMAELWASVERYLGKQREFWRWLLQRWGYELAGTR